MAGKTYTAPHPVYIGTLYTEAGVPFISEGPPGALWVEANSVDVAPDPGPLDLSVAGLSAHLETIEGLAELEALLVSEKAGKTRKGAVDAIQARIDTLLA